MLMRSTAHFTTEPATARAADAGSRLTIRERIVEADDWTIAVPAITSVSIGAQRRSGVYRVALLSLGAMAAVTGLANFALAVVTPALPILIGSLVFTAICALLSVLGQSGYVLALSTSDGNRWTVASNNVAELNDMRAFLTEKINRQDCRAIRVFQLGGLGRDGNAVGPSEALRAIAESADTTSLHPSSHISAVLPNVSLAAPIPEHEGGSTNYDSVLGQITNLHRFYEQHPQALHIRERLAEMELLMRSGTPSQAQRTRVRELALDLTNIMSAYPHMTQLFSHVTALAGR